ncbi:hypothetical protein ACETU7_28115 [Rhodococcus sp. 3Y1]
MAELSSRDRMIRSAVELISRNGVDATSFSDVIKHSGAPVGRSTTTFLAVRPS